MQKILDCLTFGKDQKTYPEEVRSFCLTLHYYSPLAYNYVRTKFLNHLPAICTMRKWYASINSAPGFTTEAFEALKLKADGYNEDGKQLYVNVIFDEMAIRQHSQWNPNRKKFDGFIDMGRQATEEHSLALAKDALVFLVSGVNEDFKIPVSYFLTNGLIAEERAALLNEILIRLADIGTVVVSITFDGLSANLAMCKIMGANFETEDAYIFDPTNGKRRIYIFLDAAHMLKLMRNCLGSRNLIDADGEIIEWKYIKTLYEMQRNLSYNLGKKLTKEHMEWPSKKMSVRLAGETLSKSVADSIDFMSTKFESFKNSNGTTKFIRTVNDSFDVMNSNKLYGANGLKRPLSISNHVEAFNLFRNAMTYLKSIRVEGESNPIFSSASCTPFIGFYFNMVNLMKIFDEYVRINKIEFLITHRISQDLIESLFGCIRSMGGMYPICTCEFSYIFNEFILYLLTMSGFNDNPTAQQFESAYRKLMIHNDVVYSKNSNCIDFGTKILTVSSNRPAAFNKNIRECGELPEDEDLRSQDFIGCSQYVDDIQDHSIAYMASVLEARIIGANRYNEIVKCEKCTFAFIENELIEDSFIRLKSRNSNILQPCKSTFEICKFVDSHLKTYEGKTIPYDTVALQILRNVSFDSLFVGSKF